MVPGEGFPAQYFNQIIGNHADWITFLESLFALLLGDGSDGDMAFDGASAVTGCSRAGTIYTLTRDIYPSSMTFTDTATLKTENYRIFCRGTIDTSASTLPGSQVYAVIMNQGGAAALNVAGTAAAAGSLAGGGAGGAGGLGGNNGTSVTNSYGGAGGDAESHGTTGGTVAAPTPVGSRPGVTYELMGYVVGLAAGVVTHNAVKGGAGGAGGADGGSGFPGGGGGAGGGCIAIAARELRLRSGDDIRARGGNGSTNKAAATAAKDGGGGGGGFVHVVCMYSNVTLTAAACCPAGLKGGAAGFDGSVGQLFYFCAGDALTVPASTAINVKSGKAILAAVDTITVTFGGADYTTATGVNGYRIKTLSLYVSDAGDPVKASVTAKTVTTFTVTFDRVVTGELDWETEGSV